MQKCEYEVESGWTGEEYLNKLGNEGWELVAVVAGGLEDPAPTYGESARGPSDVYLYFKRPKS